MNKAPCKTAKYLQYGKIYVRVKVLLSRNLNAFKILGIEKDTSKEYFSN